MLNVKLFWFDEFLTEERTFYSFTEIWNQYKTQRVLVFSLIMKLYSLLIIIFNKAKYMTENQLRFPNVILGMIGILVMFFSCIKIKNLIGGFISAAICSVSYFLVFYSREARFYPLFFIVSTLLLTFGILILSNIYSNNDKDHNKYLVCYSAIAVIGMYTHTGFWLLYAISNVFLALNEIIYSFFCDKRKSTLSMVKTLFLRIGILAMPILLSTPLLFHLTKPDSQRPVSDGTNMLSGIDYATLNKFSQAFWKLFVGQNWILVVITCMAVLLLAISFLNFYKEESYKIRLSVFYLYVIKFFPFIIALFLPRNIIKEVLLPKYILFVLCADIFLVSLFFAYYTEYLSYLLSPVIKVNKNLLSTVATAALVLFVLCVQTPRILKSDIYEPFFYLQSYADTIKKYYKSKNFILTDDLELDKYLAHETKAGKFPKYYYNVISYFSDKSFVPPDVNGLLLITTGEINFLKGLAFLGDIGIANPVTGGKGTRKFLFIPLNKKATPDVIMALTQKIIKRTPNYSYIGHNEKLSQWRAKYSDFALDEIIDTQNASVDLLKNGDFSSGLDHWKSKTNAFAIETENDFNYLSLIKQENNRWNNLYQTFNSVSGDVINISYDARIKKDSIDANEVFVVFSYVDKKGTDYNEKYFSLNKTNLSKNWKSYRQLIVINADSKVSLRIQYRKSGIADIKNISCCKFLRTE